MQERGESYYNPQLPDTVAALAEKGIIADSNGAKVVWTEHTEGVPPLMVQKSDGGFGYARCGRPPPRPTFWLVLSDSACHMHALHDGISSDVPVMSHAHDITGKSTADHRYLRAGNPCPSRWWLFAVRRRWRLDAPTPTAVTVAGTGRRACGAEPGTTGDALLPDSHPCTAPPVLFLSAQRDRAVRDRRACMQHRHGRDTAAAV